MAEAPCASARGSKAQNQSTCPDGQVSPRERPCELSLHGRRDVKKGKNRHKTSPHRRAKELDSGGGRRFLLVGRGRGRETGSATNARELELYYRREFYSRGFEEFGTIARANAHCSVANRVNLVVWSCKPAPARRGSAPAIPSARPLRGRR